MVQHYFIFMLYSPFCFKKKTLCNSITFSLQLLFCKFALKSLIRLPLLLFFPSSLFLCTPSPPTHCTVSTFIPPRDLNITHIFTDSSVHTHTCIPSSPRLPVRVHGWGSKQTSAQRLTCFVLAAFALLSYWMSCRQIAPVVPRLVCFISKVRGFSFLFFFLSDLGNAGIGY